MFKLKPDKIFQHEEGKWVVNIPIAEDIMTIESCWTAHSQDFLKVYPPVACLCSRGRHKFNNVWIGPTALDGFSR